MTIEVYSQHTRNVLSKSLGKLKGFSFIALKLLSPFGISKEVSVQASFNIPMQNNIHQF